MPSFVFKTSTKKMTMARNMDKKGYFPRKEFCFIKVADNSFQYFKTYSLKGHYNHSILVDTNIMVSTNCPIIEEQVAVNLVAQ